MVVFLFVFVCGGARVIGVIKFISDVDAECKYD